MEPSTPIPTNLDLLPDETIMNILLEVDDFETLANWCQTSKRINNICQDNVFWKRKYQQDYGNIPSLPKVSWKEKYKFNYSVRYSPPISAHEDGYSVVDEEGILYIAMASEDEHEFTLSLKTYPSGIKTIKLTPEPTAVPFNSKIISASFSRFISVLTKDGDVYSVFPWRSGTFRKIKLPEKVIQLSSDGTGIITKTNRIYIHISESPQLIPIRGIDISIRSLTYAIISTDGKLYIWGHLKYISGDNFVKEPRHVPLPELVKQVSLGSGHIVVLSITGNLYLWGQSGYGELGLGKKAASEYDNVYTKPQKLVLPEPVSHVVCGGGYTAAITENGKLYMWGQDPNDIIDPEGAAHYRRDDHEDRTIVDSPVQVDIGHPVTSIALGFKYAIAVTDDGVVNLWGDRDYELIPEPDFL